MKSKESQLCLMVSCCVIYCDMLQHLQKVYHQGA